MRIFKNPHDTAATFARTWGYAREQKPRQNSHHAGARHLMLFEAAKSGGWFF